MRVYSDDEIKAEIRKQFGENAPRVATTLLWAKSFLLAGYTLEAAVGHAFMQATLDMDYEKHPSSEYVM